MYVKRRAELCRPSNPTKKSDKTAFLPKYSQNRFSRLKFRFHFFASLRFALRRRNSLHNQRVTRPIRRGAS